MSSQSFETIMTNIQQQYEQIAAMTSATYNRDLVIQSLNIVSELFNLPREQMLKVLTIFYKILSTTAGSIFLKTNKNLTNTMVLKAKEFMDKLPYPINNDTYIELARAISKFSRVNEGVFLGHGIIINKNLNLFLLKKKCQFFTWNYWKIKQKLNRN